MHMMPYTGKVPWPSSATARGWGWGGGDDKLAIDKGGNLPEKVENHWSRSSLRPATASSGSSAVPAVGAGAEQKGRVDARF